jgi:hypothetical protein
MFRPEHYSARASELEDLAAHISNPTMRAAYLELAHSFREMASLADLARAAKAQEIVCLAECISGETSGSH